MEDLMKHKTASMPVSDRLTVLVRTARANPSVLTSLRPAIREARGEWVAFRRVASTFPRITETAWNGLTIPEKYALVKKVARKPIALPVTQSAVRNGEAFMTYVIDPVGNHSKFYEALIVPENGGFRVKRRWGALTDSRMTGRVEGEKFDNDDRFWFPSMEQAKRELAIHYATRISHGYIDAYGSKHVTPDGHRLPLGEYPVGLDRNVGFGWGTQSVTKCIPALRDLAASLSDAIGAIQAGAPTATLDIKTPLDRALGFVRLVVHADSTMGQKLVVAITKAMRRIEGGPRFVPDPEGRRLRADLVAIRNYVTKQISYCG